MNMEFLYRNLINTTTLITVNTGTADSVIDRRASSQYIASFATTTATTLTADFVVGTTVSRIVLQNMNFKNFSITYNTSNSITLLNALTTTSSWSSNSATNLYLYFSPVAINTLSIIVNSNTDASLNHNIGQIWVSDQAYQLERNPSHREFKTDKDRTEYVHELAGGGYTHIIIDDYYQADIDLSYRTKSERDNLRTVYDLEDGFVFVPFPTATGWDSEIYETIWIGKFELIQRAFDVESVGYSGKIKLRETAR